VTLRTTRELQPNDPGGQLYLPAEIVGDSAFPLDRAAECTVQTIPHRAVVVFPGDADPSFPLQFDDPQRLVRQPTDIDSP